MPADPQDTDRGSITISTLFGILVVTVIVVAVVNVLVFQFGRATVRNALDDGVRVGARAAPGTEAAVCQQVARNTIDQLAAGLGSGVTVTCVNLGTSLQATATVHFDGWLTSVSDHDSTMQATAALENRS